MITSDFSLITEIIAGAGIVAIVSVLLSGLIQIWNRRAWKSETKYECGFRGIIDMRTEFITEKSARVAIYLVVEMAIMWLLFCTALQIADSEWYGIYFIKVFTMVIIGALAIANRFLKSTN